MRKGPTDAPIFQSRAAAFLALSFAFGAGATTSLIAAEYSGILSACLTASAACGLYWLTRGRSSGGTVPASHSDRSSSEIEHVRSSKIHPITKLPTREALFDTIAATQDQPGTLALIRLADYDGLAAFDEQKANRTLIAFSGRLASSIGPGRVLTQVDRDSFALWFPDGTDRERSRDEIRAITYVARQELVEVDQMVPAIEIGLAYRPEDGNGGAGLLKRAVGVRSAPEISSTGELSLPSRLSPEVEREIFTIEKALPFAIEGKQLTLAFQPLVDLSDQRVVGAEALLRWKHPELGNVLPGQFIPIMERIGLSDMIGMWVLNAACREARHWRETGFGELRVAINLSARQMLDPALLSKVERTLARHGLDGSAIELELTETAAMADINYSRQIFSGLRDMGVKLAIDDFGSGYSSMSYLQSLPFDKLKIDRAFVTDIHARPQSRAICEAIIALGSGLNLQVLCEGVETQEELAVLHGLGCRLFQGYFFAKPMTAEAFRTFVNSPFDLNWRHSPVAAQMAQIRERFSA